MRRTEERSSAMTGAKFIAGVPVLNYHLSSPRSTDGQGDEPWIVVVKPEVSDEEIHKMCSKLNCVREGHPKKGGVPFFEIKSTESQLEDLLTAEGSMVQFVERDGEVQNVPDIDDITTMSSASWGLDRVGAPQRGSTGIGVHIYVLDTGIRTTHEDFGGRAISTLDFSKDTLRLCDGASNCAVDYEGHGSHCAGTAAGTTYGVAPAATIHSVKVLNFEGKGDWGWAYSALDWMAVNADRPAVASLSLGGDGRLSAAKIAIDGAVAAGIIVVVAAGNEDDNSCKFTPAWIYTAITVGSTNDTNTRSWFSNYGTCTNMWAPGHSITSVNYRSDTASRTKSGTSMACPHVAGGAALLLQNSPELSSKEVLSTLKEKSVKDAIKDLKCGDANFMLWVGADDAPQPISPEAPACPTRPPGFICNDGCYIRTRLQNDNYCDCKECEDEENWTCNSCGGCPIQCGTYIECRR